MPARADGFKAFLDLVTLMGTGPEGSAMMISCFLAQFLAKPPELGRAMRSETKRSGPNNQPCSLVHSQLAQLLLQQHHQLTLWD